MLVLTLLLGVLLNSCHGLKNGLALTPPMGWLSWAGFGCTTDCKNYPNKCISANLIKRTADRLVSDGYLDSGYEYLVIDGCWMEEKRAPDGRLVADRERFPLGMKDVSDYVHSKGLKFGLKYGNPTCVQYPEFLNTEKLTVKTFAEWKVDYIKHNSCLGSTSTKMDEGYKAFGKLLKDTGLEILHSCSWPIYQERDNILPNYDVIAETCNMWRNYNDMANTWTSIVSIMDWFGDNQDRLAKHAGPGHWHDPDMLAIGNSGFSEDHARVQMAVWAILAAPLLMSTDLDIIKPEFKKILLNRDIIAVNQDALGKQGLRILQRSQIDVWKRELHDGSVAIAFVNRRESGAPYTSNFTHSDLQLAEHTMYAVMDLYKEEEKAYLCETCNFSVDINPTGVKFYKFTKRTLKELEQQADPGHHNISTFMEEISALISNVSQAQNSRINKLEESMKSSLKDMNNLLRNTLQDCSNNFYAFNKVRKEGLESEVKSTCTDFNNQNEVVLQKIEHVHDQLSNLTSLTQTRLVHATRSVLRALFILFNRQNTNTDAHCGS